MKIGEYRTNGKAVAYRRDVDSLLLWADAESDSTTRPCTDGNAEILTHGWRTMLPGEVSLWCAPPSPVDAVSAKDWMGMWDVARLRADTAEAEVKRLRSVIASLSTIVGRWQESAHCENCLANTFDESDCGIECGATDSNAARIEACRLLGLEV